MLAPPPTCAARNNLGVGCPGSRDSEVRGLGKAAGGKGVTHLDKPAHGRQSSSGTLLNHLLTLNGV